MSTSLSRALASTSKLPTRMVRSAGRISGTTSLDSDFLLLLVMAAPVSCHPSLSHSRRPLFKFQQRTGHPLPKPEKLAREAQHPWKTCKATLYGETRTVEYKELLAQW